MNTRITTALIAAAAGALLLTACGGASETPVATSSAAPVDTSSPAASSVSTVTVQPPVTVTAPAAPAAPTTVTAPVAPAPVVTVQASGVLGQPQGLLCADLQERGYSYEDAYSYWTYWGRPSNMDIDSNGIPCQTVYPAAPGYVGTSAPAASTVPTPYWEIYSLPSGLLCRDLRDQGYSYQNAYDYWVYWNRPSNMDIDSNGVPCETVWAPNER